MSEPARTRLAHHGDRLVRCAFASRHDLTTAETTALADDADNRVLGRVAANPNVPETTARRVATSPRGSRDRRIVAAYAFRADGDDTTAATLLRRFPRSRNGSARLLDVLRSAPICETSSSILT